jgi:CheY-like chemotaxis protein
MVKKSKEDRVFKRVPFTEDILINGVLVRAIDISEGGMYVHTGRSIPPGKVFKVTIPLKNDNFDVKAKVQHSQDGIGMGLKFLVLDDEKKDKIASLINSIQAESGVSGETKKGILVVDDNDATIRIIKSRLILEGFFVLETASVKKAVEILTSQEQKINLIVLEPNLKKMDGLKVLSMIQDNPRCKDTPAIVFSSTSRDIDKKLADDKRYTVLPKMTTSPSKLVSTIKAVVLQSDPRKTKRNCWQFTGCGREPGGKNSKQKGICIAALEDRLDGVHGGKNAGRACWAVACIAYGGDIKNTTVQNFEKCLTCNFYKLLKKEEGKGYQDTIFLLTKLENSK